jgi:hypothetical protein
MIGFDAVSDSGPDQNSISSATWNHTCSALANLLAVGVSLDYGSAVSISSVTYNGVNLSQVRQRTQTNGRVELWYLKAPASGTHAVVVNLSGMLGAGDNLKAAAISLTVVDQSATLDSGGIASSGSLTYSTVNDGAWAVDIIQTDTGGAGLAPSAGQTSRYSRMGSVKDAAMSTRLISTHGSITESWSGSVAHTALASEAFIPATGVIPVGMSGGIRELSGL